MRQPIESRAGSDSVESETAISSVVSVGVVAVAGAAVLWCAPHIVARTPMPAPAPMQREAVALIVVPVRSMALMALRRLHLASAGDEGREPIDLGSAFALRRRLLGTLRIDRLLARGIGLRVARQERLRLAGAEGGFAAGIGLLAAHVLAVVALIVA